MTVEPGPMRLRETLASLLTMLLLSLSIAASNCEVTCELSAARSTCHSAQHFTPSQHSPMPDMAGMKQNPAFHSGVSSARNPELVSPLRACVRHTCSQQPALPVKHQATTRVPARIESSTPQASQDVPEVIPGSLSSRGPPQFRPETPVDLHTTLLV